jgi:hypothetical protein
LELPNVVKIEVFFKPSPACGGLNFEKAGMVSATVEK